ncbi:Integrase, catalytic core, phage domain protein [Candidatus Magnetoovum chiemensis]|nr:Integrase, catalytic core, phage domain protein [Candidatus Magnetoovum chiemensis]
MNGQTAAQHWLIRQHFEEALKGKVSDKTFKEYWRILNQMLNGNCRINSRSKYLQALAVVNHCKANYIGLNYNLPKWSKRSDGNLKRNVIERLLDADKLDKILNACPNTAKGNELKFAILISYNSGLRLSEVLALTPSDIIQNGYIRVQVQGKGGKYRTAYLRKTADIDLSTFTGFTITQSYVETNVKRIADKTSINFTFHSLRHTFATELLKNNVKLPKVSQLLGHASMTTTLVYLHAIDDVDDDMKQAGF